MDDAGKYGIVVAPLSPQQTAIAAANAERDANAERRATEFVRGLLAHWSKPTAEGLPALEPLYADTVVFQGKSTPKREVLSSKRRVAERFNERTYTIQPGSLTISAARRRHNTRA